MSIANIILGHYHPKSQSSTLAGPHHRSIHEPIRPKSQAMDNAAKKLKKGEQLFKEGDVLQVVYLIQSGKIGLMVERGTSAVEVATVGGSQVLGDGSLFSNSRAPFSAIALQETRYLEVPIELMKQQFEKTPPGVKLIVKSLSDDLKGARQQFKMIRMETEKSPMPQGLIHRLFTELHLIARHIGKPEPLAPDVQRISWQALKLYASRFFGESPQRLRSLMDLLSKLKMAELQMGKNDEGEVELQDIKLHKLQLFEDFAEFYQYHLFKGSRAEAIYVDPIALRAAKAFYEISEKAEVDHKGASRVDYGLALSECKSKYGFELKNTHLDSLERKGLFVTRKSFDDGRVEIAFDRVEFGRMAQFWSILFEIDKWNEHGHVNLNELPEAKASDEHLCAECQGAITESQKFCPNCGFKLAA
jgi:CRP-like cAMP-binding protein